MDSTAYLKELQHLLTEEGNTILTKIMTVPIVEETRERLGISAATLKILIGEHD